MKKLLLIAVTSFVLLAMHSCKTSQEAVVLTHDLNVKDTLIRHEVESIVLPQRNYVVFENPCPGDFEIPNQTIENENSTVTIGSKDQSLFVQVDIDSIVNARLSETRIKSEVERVEIPVEIKVPVKNPINFRLLIAVIGLLAWTFRKPIFWLVRKIISPIS